MNGRKARLARQKVYGDDDPLDRKYRVASDKKGLVVGKFVTVNNRKILLMPTIMADYTRQAYQNTKKEMRNA